MKFMIYVINYASFAAITALLGGQQLGDKNTWLLTWYPGNG